MHCCDIGFGSATIANVFYDAFYKELYGKKGEKMSKLLQLIQDSYDAVGIREGKISKLSLSHFCDPDGPHKNCPDLLHSTVKAKQTANCQPFASLQALVPEVFGWFWLCKTEIEMFDPPVQIAADPQWGWALSN